MDCGGRDCLWPNDRTVPLVRYFVIWYLWLLKLLRYYRRMRKSIDIGLRDMVRCRVCVCDCANVSLLRFDFILTHPRHRWDPPDECAQRRPLCEGIQR